MFVRLPDVYDIDELLFNNPIRRIGNRGSFQDGELRSFQSGKLVGQLFRAAGDENEVLILGNPVKVDRRYQYVAVASIAMGKVADAAQGKWQRHPLRGSREGVAGRKELIDSILASWSEGFAFAKEDPEQSKIGLRNPQIGALHAIHAHWSISNEPATVVLPTGTGKTDTMISVLVSVGCSKLMIVVPTDALRNQLSSKFTTLGILKDPGCRVLIPSAEYPVVCTLFHRPHTAAEVDDIFSASQVVVTTSSILSSCTSEVQERMSALCPYLFIDEAHHAEAPTWSAFREKFEGSKILQFTATPFREDGKRLTGEIIFNYPLRKAQQEGYFKPIRFTPVRAYNRNRSDIAIAKRAIEQLDADKDNGHILMARVDSVARAKEVFKLYADCHEYKPVQLHSGITSSKQRALAREDIQNGRSRIVVCVDMLGEGFDLPELKIAAFHDIRKSLAVTLQLAGRFTRSRPGLGQATFIANTGDVNVADEIKKLYARDPDWNVLLPELSEKTIGNEMRFQEFLRGFPDLPEGLPLRVLRPAMSTVVYKTHCPVWRPENFRDGLPNPKSGIKIFPSINHEKRVMVLVTVTQGALEWAEVDNITMWQWDLYVLFWSERQNLLFINSSANTGEYKTLAKAVGGDDLTLIQGQDVFRVFSGINRITLNNVGMSEQLGRNIRYTARMGSDVAPALTDVLRRRGLKSVVAGSGFERGESVNIAASRKGRIWSHERGRLDNLTAWCQRVGDKLLDDGIDPDQILKGTLQSETVTARPYKMPVAIDWPEVIYSDPETSWIISFGGKSHCISDLSIELVEPDSDGPLMFKIASETDLVKFSLEFPRTGEDSDYEFVALDATPCVVQRGNSGHQFPIGEFFHDDPPVVWFFDGSSLEGNELVELRHTQPPFDASRIKIWDWSGVDLKKETQGDIKDTESIQHKVIVELKKEPYDIIFDDDGAGEAADVVAIRIDGDRELPERIIVEFYHCKYVKEGKVGRRVADLYEVCGQAQKSIHWLTTPEKRIDLFSHLLRREENRIAQERPSRIDWGDEEKLNIIKELAAHCLVELRIAIVQPGLSQEGATEEQLRLISVTETYLHETYQLPLTVIGSP